MTALSEIIKARIVADGPMTMADYMSECLLHPTLGYYTTSQPFGRAGDFVTAPEISQMFGELIGLCLAQAWMDQGMPSPFALVEVGPGKGTLMADLLRATARVPGFHASMKVNLVEASPRLQSIQKTSLSAYDVIHHKTVESLPDLPTFLVANEFFDALPVRQFHRDDGGWRERLVGVRDDELTLGLSDPISLSELPERFRSTPVGKIVELCPLADPILRDLSARIATYGGLALIIDYGDWRSQGDTVQAMSNHAYVNIFETPGLADLTAHVDFEALSLSCANVRTAYTTQGNFLTELGIASRAEVLARKLSGAALQNHLSALRRLTHSDEMGRLFKVLALYQHGHPEPAGFSLQEQT